jgi:phospho-N-acetylmuramoyl-pentapeptide-transferase
MILDVIKVFLPTTIAFALGIIIATFLNHYLYKYKMWKPKAGKVDMSGGETPVYNKLYENRDVGTPRMGGVVIWLSVFMTTFGIWILDRFLPFDILSKLDFLSRSQTWIPLAVLMLGALVGLLDDYMEIKGAGTHKAGGLSLKHRLSTIVLVGLFVSLWFYFKLDVSTINLPFIGEFFVGGFFIPIFIAVILALYASGVIDGLDGLSGGIFGIIFSAYSVIAFFQNQIDLAAFCAVVTGGILAFLWFNIPPARFYMSETGSMALTATLCVIAFMTDSIGGGIGVSILPIVAFPLTVTVLANIIQIVSKKFRNGKKVFIAAPIHHHFEALGWPHYKIVMRYWVISIIFAIVGIVIAFIAS